MTSFRVNGHDETYSHVSNVSLQSVVKRMEQATKEKQNDAEEVIPFEASGKKTLMP
jgi:hypothetical protein